MHGGAAGAGAPRGNRNARKHGWWSAAAEADRRHVAALLDEGARMLADL
jgi:glucans biosynthesis protein